MQVFKTFFKILNKQKHQFIIYISIFGVLLGVLSNVGGNERKEFQGSKMDIVVFDYDNSEESKYLMEYMYSLHNKVDVEDDREEIQDNLYWQTIDYVLYIDEGYSETGKLSNIKREGTKASIYVEEQIEAYQKSFDAYVAAGYSSKEANEKTIAALDSDGLVNYKGKSSVALPKQYYYFTYMTYILIMLLMNVMAPIIMVFNKKEIKDRNSVAPMTLKSRSTQLIGASAVLSIAVWAALIIVAAIMFKGQVFVGTNALNLLSSFVFLLLTVGIVCIVSSFNLKAPTISMISNIIALGMAFLGGVFVPMEIFSDGILKIARFMPTYWQVKATESLYVDGGLDTFFKCVGIEALFAVAFMAIALIVAKVMKQRREG
ncbi:MAG: ABC transporter permease [Lachnospiraceae bacterium]|nr:ABC transporter permease [Lachnospiraceae bacterium]